MTTMTAAAPLAVVNDPEDLRSYLLDPPGADAAAELFAEADALLIFSRHHWLMFDGEYHGRKEFKDRISAVAALAPAEWSESDAALLLCLVALRRAGMGLEQVDENLTTDTVRDALDQRLSLYLEALGHPRPLHHLPLLEMAGRVGELRAQIERDHHRYSLIDGRRWYRQEGLIPRRGVRPDPLPEPVLEALRPFAPAIDQGLAMPDYLAAVTRVCLAERGQTTALVDALLELAVRDPLLRVDHATVTCVRGVLLECPATLSDSSQFYTHTAIGADVDLGEYAEQLGHASEQRLRATLKARMIKLKRKAVENYYGSGCLAGQWVEKAADNMIFFHEDTHYRGHQTVGVSTGGRSAFSVDYVRGGAAHTLPPMMGDFRAVRLSHAEADRFAPDDLARVICYAQWTKYVVQETFRAGGVLEVAEGDGGGACPHTGATALASAAESTA